MKTIAAAPKIAFASVVGWARRILTKEAPMTRAEIAAMNEGFDD